MTTSWFSQGAFTCPHSSDARHTPCVRPGCTWRGVHCQHCAVQLDGPIGERGPETFTPSVAARILTARDIGGAA